MGLNYRRAISVMIFFLAACGDGQEKDTTITEQLPTPENVIVAIPSEVLTEEISLPSPSPTPTRPSPTPSVTFTTTPSEGIIVIGSADERPFAVSAVPESTTLPTAEIVVIPPVGTSETETSSTVGGRLQMGQSEFDEITQAGETHRYTFFGNSGETVSILANLDPSDDSTFNPYLEIQAPDGEIIATNNDMRDGIPDALIPNFTVPVTGVYTVYVKSADELSRGKYILTLNNTPLTVRDVLRGEARHSLPNPENLETYGERDVWEIELEAGDLISIAVQADDPASGLDVMAELVSPTGESLAFDSDSGGGTDAYIDSIPITENGRHRIHVAARNNASIGGYTLWWQRLNEIPTGVPPTLTPVPTVPPARDTLELSLGAAETFTYRIFAAEGQDVNIAVLGQNGFDPVLRVSDPIGKIIIEVDDVGSSADPRASFVAEASGLYTLEVFGFEEASGNFTLNYIVQ